MILKIGVVGKYFILNGKSCQCGHYDYEIASDGYLLIWDKVGSNKNNATRALLADVLDGNNSNTAFANQAAIETWLNANFFFIGGGSGASDWDDISGKPTEFTPEAHSHDGNDIISGIVPAIRLGNTTPDNTKVLYGDSVWRTAPGGLSGLTANYIPKAASSSTINDSVLYQDSGNLYINATTPYGFGGAKLTVKGNFTISESSYYYGIVAGYSGFGPSMFIQSYGTHLTLNPEGNRVAINTYTPHASCVLDIESTTGGVGFPRMSTTQRTAIPTPRKGLVVYDTTQELLYVYNGAWVALH